MLLFPIVVGCSLIAWRCVVCILAVALTFVFLIAALSYLHQTPVGRIGVGLIGAGDATVREVAVLEIVCLLLLDVVRLRAAAAAVHEIHVGALILLQLALLLLLRLHALVHLIRDVQGNLFVGARMRVEELVRLLGAQEEDAVLQILLLQLGHFLVHDQGLGEVFELALALSLDLCIDLDEHFEIPGHHVRQWVAARLHLLQGVIDFLYLLLPFQLALLGLEVVQHLKQRLDFGHALLAKLTDV